MFVTPTASVRGDYDYCRVAGIKQQSPLEIGEDELKIRTQKSRKKI